VVWHEDITAHEPRICGFPSLAKGVVNGFISQNLFFALRANGEKDNGRTVPDFSQILTGGMASSNGIHVRKFSHVQEVQKTKIGGTTAVSSDFREAQPSRIRAKKAALVRGNNGRRRSIALQGS
jgi:hypothetical protein